MKRAISLDVFRGYAIVTMVLSGTIASGVLHGVDVSCSNGATFKLYF